MQIGITTKIEVGTCVVTNDTVLRNIKWIGQQVPITTETDVATCHSKHLFKNYKS